MEKSSLQHQSLLTAGDKYTMYIEIFNHYSSLIFKARISIITVIFLSFGYIFGIVPHKEDGNQIPEIVLALVLPVCSSGFVSLIFLTEVAYFKMFFKSIKALRYLEGYDKPVESTQDSFFAMYTRKHWHFTCLYLVASLVFTVVYFSNLYFHWNDINGYSVKILALGFGCVPFPFMFWVWVLLNASYHSIIENDNLTKKEVFLVSIGKHIKKGISD